MDNNDFKIVDCAGGIVVNDKGQIALIFMPDIGAWDFPKGGVEEREDFFEAAKREIYEETGIVDLELVRKLPVYARVAANGNPVMMNTQMFLFRSHQDKLCPVEDDVSQAKWVKNDEVVTCLTLPEAKEYFESVSLKI